MDKTLRTLYIILGLQFVLVFLVSISIFSMPSDMMENLLWGRNLDFSSDKHPPFFSWESYLFVKAFGGNFLFYYLLSPIHQFFLFLFVFLLAKKILKSNDKALIATIFASGIIFHLFHYRFNANVANYGLFGAIYFLFYTAIKDRKYSLFLIIGALCGIGMLIKYSAIILIFTLWLTIFSTSDGRKALKSPFLYLGVIVFALVLTPYILNINYGALSYLVEQSSTKNPNFWSQILYFILVPIIFCLPFLIAFFMVKGSFIHRPKNFDTMFLLINAFVPFILVLLHIIITRSQVGTFCLTMYYTLFPICALYFFKIKQNALKISIKIIYTIILLLYLIYLVGAIFNAEDDTKEIGEFTRKVNHENIKDFVCNDSRRVCGIVILYGTNYPEIKMKLSRFSTTFEDFHDPKFRPKKFIIIGEDDPINLPNYKFECHKKSFPKYFKFHFLKSIIRKFPKRFREDIEKLGKPVVITLTIATLDQPNL